MKNRHQQLKTIFQAGLDRVNPYEMMKKHLRLEKDQLLVSGDTNDTLDLKQFKRIVVLGTGKATARMALAVESVLGDRISHGVISVKYGHTEPLQYTRMIEAGHPVPDENSVQCAKEIMAAAKDADEQTLVILLVSGGGSALMAAPYSPDESSLSLDLKHKQQTTRLLLECGATINEINCIRKHLSAVKGGRLARMLHPAATLCFILSDVVGDSLDAIASGPVAADSTTFRDMDAIIRKYDIAKRLPQPVTTLLKKGMAGKTADTPKSGSRYFQNIQNIMIGTNFQSLEAAREQAEKMGFTTVLLSSQITGEAGEAAKVLCGIAKDVRKHHLFGPLPVCLIAGGETTVTLRGNGKGGRNQQMALAFLAEMENDPDGTRTMTFLSAATDGNDGPTDAAGAFASIDILEASRAKGLCINDYLKNNDAYSFFDSLGGLLKTGPTNTNVCDLQIIVIEQ